MAVIRFIVAGDPATYTGGYLYDARIVQALKDGGRRVNVISLAGRFPDPDDEATAALDQALADCDAGDTVIIDGLALGGLPDVIARYAESRHLVALIHHPLADEQGLDPERADYLLASERKSLGLVAHVIVTSRFTAQHLISAYGVPKNKIDVVEPGVDRPSTSATAEQTQDSSSLVPRLLCVAALVPRKGHSVLIEALSQLQDLDWDCECVGDLQRDPACTEAVRVAIAQQGLEARVRLVGAFAPPALAQAYRQAQVFILPSYYEGYGMVIAEALSYGLPIVTTMGGALAQTLPPGAGLAVPAGDVAALARALERVLTDEMLRAALARSALRAASVLPGWEGAGARFATVLDRLQD